jgi:hypothetical protein
LWKSKKQKVGLFTRISMGGNMLICVQGRKEKEERKLVNLPALVWVGGIMLICVQGRIESWSLPLTTAYTSSWELKASHFTRISMGGWQHVADLYT